MQWISDIVVCLYFVYRIPKLVKVKAHTRVRDGKRIRVRSHYRLMWGHRW